MRSLLSILLVIALASCNNNQPKSTATDPQACTQYACPMHPDKTSAKPNKCPLCGMEMKPDSVREKKSH